MPNRNEVLQEIAELIKGEGYSYCDVVPEVPPIRDILSANLPAFFITYDNVVAFTPEHPEVVDFTATITVFMRNFSDKLMSAGALEIGGYAQFIASILYISQQSMNFQLLGVVRLSTPPMVVDKKTMLQKVSVAFDISTVEDELYDISGY